MLHINETFAVTFICNVTGSTIQWYRDQTLLGGTMGSDFNGTDLNICVVLDEPNVHSSLGEVSSVLMSLTAMNGDTGTYRCEAIKEAVRGTDVEVSELFVQGTCSGVLIIETILYSLCYVSLLLHFLPLLLLWMMTKKLSQTSQCHLYLALELLTELRHQL